MKTRILPGILASFGLFWFGMGLGASPVRISFLDNEAALQQTSDLLAANGCDSNTINIFRMLVRWQNESPLGVDLKAFPKADQGFYTFRSVTNLIAALPQPLIDADHPQQFNCFDVVTLLAGNLMQTGVGPDDPCGPLVVPVTVTNHEVRMAIVGTYRDAFSLTRPEGFTKASDAIFGPSKENKHICLAGAIETYSILPSSTTIGNLKSTLLMTLKTGWKRQTIVFPTHLEIVICHSVKISTNPDPLHPPFDIPAHAGILLKIRNQFVFLEKEGATGPYVRLDFESKQDLLPWLKSVIEPAMSGDENLFATFNDQEIESLYDAVH